MKPIRSTLFAAAAVCALFAATPAHANYSFHSSAALDDNTVTTRTVSSTQLSSADVATLQQRLADRGYNVGAIDGVYGPRTDAAVRSFQRNNGMAPDGRLTTGTLDALNLASNDMRSEYSSMGNIEPAAGEPMASEPAYTETTTRTDIYTTRSNRGFSADQFDAAHSTCLECTDGIYGNGGRPDGWSGY